MAWARIDDAFFNHPKVRKAGKDAVIFHMAALCHSNAFTTDGFIANDMLELIATQAFQRRPKVLAELLVACDLWDRIEGGYLIHDYLEYNYSKQQVEEIKSKRAAAGRQGGKQNASKTQANSKQNESKIEAKLKQNESHTHTHINTHTNTDNNPTNQSSSIEAKRDDDDDVYKNFQAIAEVTPQVKTAIDQAVATYGEAWVKDAISEGVRRGANTFAYVEKILASWKASGNKKSKDTRGSYEYFKGLRKGAA